MYNRITIAAIVFYILIYGIDFAKASRILLCDSVKIRWVTDPLSC